jgi:hypothetical protein
MMQHPQQLAHLILLLLVVIEFTNGLLLVQLHFEIKKMSHYAKVENGIVTQVIVAGQDVIDSGLFGTGWVQTSYNTHGGQHPENRPMRKNYAGVGFTYDSQKDAFIPPKPFASWTLNEETCLWDCPVSYPTDGKVYIWNEDQQQWIESLGDSITGGSA